MKLAKLLSKALPLALCAALLAVSAGAAAPLISPAPDDAPEQEAQPLPSAVCVWGRLTKLGDDTVRVQNSGGAEDSIDDIVLHIHEDTLVLNAVDGSPISLDDLKDGDTVYAYVSPAMMLSLPPQAAAFLILGQIPADFGVPAYAQVTDFKMVSTKMSQNNIITAIVSTDQGDTLRFNLTDELDEAGNRHYILKDEVAFTAYQSDEAAQVTDLIPGARILVWTDAEGAPAKVMVFPYSYSGYLQVLESGAVSLNGQALDSAAVAGENGSQLLPLRAVCEALGLTVGWDNDTDTITVSRADPEGVVFTYTVGGGSAQAGEEEIALLAPSSTYEGRTFLTVSDLVRLLDLYLMR